MFFCKRLQEGGNVQDLKEQLEALTAHVDYVQENITDCQTSIMEMEVGQTWYTSSYITVISPRIYKSSCIANFSEKERKIKTNNRNKSNLIYSTVNYYYHQYTRLNSKLPSSKHLISGHNDHVRAANSFTALLLIGWGDVVRLLLPNQKARVKVRKFNRPSSCFLSRTVLTKLLRLRKLRISTS